MTYVTPAPYRGRIQAVIFDWAGTTVDYGCCAPAGVFVRVFAQEGVVVTPAQARGPMGLMKRDHIRAILQLEPVAQQWGHAHGRLWTEADVEALYQAFIPLQLACLADFADVIPGTLHLVSSLRAAGVKLGSTTGYNREMMELYAPLVARNGYAPDVWVCSTDVSAGRPYPWMLYANAEKLGVYPPAAIVKIGDTVPDIQEGRNAGVWTMGLAQSGNELGLTRAEAEALSTAELRERLDPIYGRLYAAGAHYVVDGLWAVEPVLEEINHRLAAGEQP